MAKVVTDKDVLGGRQIQHAERDNDGTFHFHSKLVFDLSEIRHVNWDELVSIHAEISAFSDQPIGWRAHRTAAGWETE